VTTLSSRAAAAQALIALERGHTTLAAEIDRARRDFPDERDRALLLELTAGTLRWRGAIDSRLARCLDRPIAALDAPVRAVLRIAIYQLDYLDRVPAHAILDEAVESARALNHPAAAGFVNGVLRTFLRTRATLGLPPRPDAAASQTAQRNYLSETLSHPEWLIERWLSRFTFDEVETWCRFNNRAPGIALRSRGRLTASELIADLRAAGIDAEPGALVSSAIRMPAGALGRLPAPLRDELVPHEEGSQIVAHLARAAAGERVLDACASPGGKTAILYSQMSRSAGLIAADRRPRRLRLLRSTLQKSAIDIPIVALDAAEALPFGPVFDCVLLDAPCSGLGTLSRDPDVKWSRTESDLAAFAAVQRRMLARVGDAVRPGGRIVYATCSSEPDENEAVVEAFLEADRRFELRASDPGPEVAAHDSLVDARGFLRTWPFRHGLDAFFGAVLVRRGLA